jgi:hypothetical protein
VLAIAAAVLLVVLASAVWLLVSGLRAREHLSSAVPAVQQLEAHVADGNADAARAVLPDLQRETSQPRDLTDGPVWAVAAVVPVVGDDVAAVTAGGRRSWTTWRPAPCRPPWRRRAASTRRP